MLFLPTITTIHTQTRNCPTGKFHISNLHVDISDEGMQKISVCPKFTAMIPALDLPQSKITYSLANIFISSLKNCRYQKANNTTIFFSLNLNDWLRYSLFQGNPCWISHYSVCLRYLCNGNLGFGPLRI